MLLAKITSKNQLTLPKKIVEHFEGTRYMEVEMQKNGALLLKPLRLYQADAVRKKLEKLGITTRDIHEAIRWARKS